jgi:hypothetical protein
VTLLFYGIIIREKKPAANPLKKAIYPVDSLLVIFRQAQLTIFKIKL